MAYRLALIAALLAASGSAFAGYAQLQPPSGWSGGSTGGNSVGTFKRNPGPVAANGGKWLLKTVVTDSSLSVGGRAVTVPAALRLASNAGRFAAGHLFSNPLLRFGVWGAAFLAAEFIWDEASQTWRRIQDSQMPEDGKYWRSNYWNNDNSIPWRTSRDAACQDGISYRNGLDDNAVITFTRSTSMGDCYGNRKYRIGETWIEQGEVLAGSLESKVATGQACPEGWQETPAGCLSPAVTKPEFVDEVGPNAVPDGLPNEWPDDLPWPVELPKINPGPAPDYNPRPFFIPQGDPVPNPNYDPNAEPSPENLPYVRPGINVKPANEPDLPWNVDLKPIDRPSETDESNPSPDMDGPEQPNDKPREPQDVGLCDLYPDILACTKLGDLQPVDIPKDQPDFSITPASGFGPSVGTCPAPREVTYLGVPLSFKFDLICQFAGGIRPVVVAFAWLSAVLIFVGALKRG